MVWIARLCKVYKIPKTAKYSALLLLNVSFMLLPSETEHLNIFYTLATNNKVFIYASTLDLYLHFWKNRVLGLTYTPHFYLQVKKITYVLCVCKSYEFLKNKEHILLLTYVSPIWVLKCIYVYNWINKLVICWKLMLSNQDGHLVTIFIKSTPIILLFPF